MITPHDLAEINNFERLVDFLRGQLEWPIPEDYDFEDVTYEYEATELGLKPDQIAKIREVHQLRPLATNQPWGIFFVSFEDKGLPITVMRRILRSLVLTKRAGAKDAARAAWQRNDLLFISAHGKGGARELSFAHFADGKENGDLPVLRVLNWNREDTVSHNQYIIDMMQTRLRWPDDPADQNEWRALWGSAFQVGYREAIKTSKDLSTALAALAGQIRQRANELLQAEADAGPLRQLHKAFRENLIQDLSEDDFADMFAQTISYGLLAARISRYAGDAIEEGSGMSGGLNADNLADMIPSTNPFLKELFGTFLKLGGRDKRKEMDFDELGVRDVVDMLNRANMGAVLRDFGDKNPKEDPVIHFYELFLKEYDPAKRMQRGVFYTPRPVVNFIVRGVDEVLRTEFGLPLGLADTTTWGELAARNPNITVPDHVDPDEAFVQILDPATGTGTFLVEVIGLIHTRMVETWKADGKTKAEIEVLWRAYVPKHLLPRLTAFELMMAPYAIAHMKLGLKLFETGYRFEDDVRARVFLTNALQPPRKSGDQAALFGDALAHEGAAADSAKAKTPFTVVIGNPPYSKISSNLGPNAVALVEKYRSIGGERIRERGALAFEMALQDDYVKFFGLVDQIQESSVLMVSGMISNSRYLNGLYLRGLRYRRHSTFNLISTVDLGGQVSERGDSEEPDENVFDIEQGVAVSLCAKVAGSTKHEVKYCRLHGGRDAKFDALLNSTIAIANELVAPADPMHLFVTRDLLTGESEYSLWVQLEELAPLNSGAIITSRDNLLLDYDRNNLLQKIVAFSESPIGSKDIMEKIGFSAKASWNLEKAKLSVKSDVADGTHKDRIFEILYRAFDKKFLYFDTSLVDTPSVPVCKELMGYSNLCLDTPRIKNTGDINHFLVADVPCEKKAVSHDRATQMFPLWLQPTPAEPYRRPNFDVRLARSFGASIGLAYEDGSPKGQGDLGPKFREQTSLQLDLWDGRSDLNRSFGPRDLFDWIYAVLHCPAYRTRYAEFLKSDFPRIPRPGSRDLFAALIPLGRQLVALHLLKPEEAPVLHTPEIRLAGSGEVRVAKGYPKFENGKVMINASRWFEDVPHATWEFKVGGYQVLDKWLKDRAEKGGRNPKLGRVLTDEDILHYRRIVVALSETHRLMTEIDRVIEAHGGWPGAFANSNHEEEETP